MLSLQEKQVVDQRLQSNVRYVKLQKLYHKYTKQHDYVRATKARKEMECIAFEYIKQYEIELGHNKKSFNELTLTLNDDQVWDFRSRATCAGFIADILDTCIRDMNDILQKGGSDFRVEVFDDVNDCAQKLKSLFTHFKGNSDAHEILWADYADSIEQYLFMRCHAYNKKDIALSNKIARKQQTNINKQDY